MIDVAVVDDLRRELSGAVHLGPVHHTVIRAGRKSGVERLRFSNGHTVVFKYATWPYTTEDVILTHLAQAGIPVPNLYAATMRNQVLGMAMQDLDLPVRHAGPADAAIAAARLHTAAPAPRTPTWDTARLAGLPAVMTAQLARLHGAGRCPDTDDIAELLGRLEQTAPSRADDADRAPYGFCHGKLHAASLHIGPVGWHALDVAQAFTGPGLLDLATWQDASARPDPAALRDLIGRYVTASGHLDTLAERAGLAPELWALAWHRLRDAHRRLTDSTGDLYTNPEDDLTRIEVIRCQLKTAAAIFDPPTRLRPTT